MKLFKYYKRFRIFESMQNLESKQTHKLNSKTKNEFRGYKNVINHPIFKN